MKWNDLRTEIWAKSQQKDQPRGESLEEHTFEVIRRLAELRTRFPRLAEQIGDERLWCRIFWACFLHDIGKAASPWQHYIRGKASRWGHRHEIASLGFLPWLADPDSPDYRWIVAAIASHHRDAPPIDELYNLSYPDDMALDTMFMGFDDSTLKGLAEWVSQAPKGLMVRFGFDDAKLEVSKKIAADLDTVAFRNSLASGSVIQALKSYKRLRRELVNGNSQLNRAAIVYRGLIFLADRLASANAYPLLEFIAPSEEQLLQKYPMRDHQAACTTASGSIILTAPTGSGKTEAAQLWAGKQQAEQSHRRTLFYLLPYQASLNAMHHRLEKTLDTKVGLLHGRSTQALYRYFMDEGYDAVRAAKSARLARNLASLQQPAVQVATPYQLLRAAYRLKGFELTWTALNSALLVVDEVHAYEPKRMGLLLGMLRRLVRDWDVQVCALTATMPTWLREILKDSLCAQTISASTEDFRTFGRHELRMVDGNLESAEIRDKVVELVEKGQGVLVAANTVKNAQDVWDYLSRRLGDDKVSLLHGRFAARDRLQHETALMERFGVDAHSRKPGVVVATQTIEVSLNLDFDTIISEPAPLEALAQRFGRVNRKKRLQIAPVQVLTNPTNGQGIYDERLVKRTLESLIAYGNKPIDEASLTKMLDSVYADGLAEEFENKVRESSEIFERFCLDGLHAFESDDSLEEQFDELFDGTEVLPAALEDEFRNLIDQSPLDANGLLVPISYRQLAMLKRLGKVRPGQEMHRIVDVHYDSVLGLQLAN